MSLPWEVHPLQRLLRLSVYTAGALVSLIGAALLYLVIYASLYPIDVSFLVPRITAEAERLVPSYRTSMQSLELTWQASRHQLTLSSKDIQLVPHDSAGVIHVPSATIDISMRKLLIGELQIQGVTIENAQLRVSLDQEASTDEAHQNNISFDANSIAKFFTAKNTGRALALPSINISNANLVVYSKGHPIVDIAGFDLMLHANGDTAIDTKIYITAPSKTKIAADAFSKCDLDVNAEDAFCSLDLKIKSARARDVVETWPKALLPEVQAWLATNLHEGVAKDFHLHTEIKVSNATGVELVALSGRFVAADAVLQYVDKGPNITQLTADASFDTNGFYLKNGRGNLLGIELKDVTLDIGNDASNETILALSTNFSGDTKAFAKAAETEPVVLWTNTGSAAEFTKGQGTGQFALNLALRSDMSDVYPKFELSADIKNAATAQPLWSSILLHDATIMLRLKQNARHVDGSFKLDDGNTNVRGTIFVPEFLDQGTIVTVKGSKFDLNSLVFFNKDYKAPAAPGTATAAATNATSSAAFRIDVQKLDDVVFADRHVLSQANVVVKQKPAGALNIEVTGRQARNKNIFFRLEDSNITGRCSDSGMLLSALGYQDILSSGDLFFSGTRTSEPFTLSVNAEVTDVDVHHFPLFARVLAVSSVADVVEQLKGSNAVRFEKVTFGLKTDGTKFTVREGKAISPLLGLNIQEAVVNNKEDTISASGVLLPIRVLSSMISSIPIAGNWIINKNGNGLLGVNFKVEGKLAEPDVRINPISALTPNIVQKAVGEE